MEENKLIRPFEDQDINLEMVNFLVGRGFITGKSGSGKSNTGGVIAEEILDNSYPLLIIDTEGEYYGLKEEYELLHVGADEECDLQVSAEHAEKIADLCLNQNVPVILDVSGYIDEEERNKLVYKVSKHLFAKEKKLKKPFMIMLEESHEFIPQSGSVGEDGEVSEMLIRIGKRGRKRGLGITAMSQRPASVDKDFITQCDYRIWHKLDYPSDLSVVKDVLGPTYQEPIKGLDIGHAFLEADFIDLEEVFGTDEGEKAAKVNFRRKETFDAGATPDLEDFEKPELKSVSEDLVEELQTISEKKKKREDELERLKEQKEELEEKLEEKDEELERAKDMSEMADRLTKNLTASEGGEVEEEVRQIREEKDAKIREQEKKLEEYKEKIKTLQEEVAELEDFKEYKEKAEEWEKKQDTIEEAVVRLQEVTGIDVDADTEKYRKRAKKLEDKVKKLEKQIEKAEEGRTEDLEDIEKYEKFLEIEEVKEMIDEAREEASVSKAVDVLIASIVRENGPVDYQTVVDNIGHSTTSHVSKAASRLEERNIVTKSKKNGSTYVDIDTEAIEDIREAKKRKQVTEKTLEKLDLGN